MRSEGNGGANDFTRGFATLSYSIALAKPLGVSAEEVAKRIAFVWSGGTEGVLSPHATLFTRSASEKAAGKRPAFGLGVTRDFAPEEIGTLTEVREVAAAVRRAQDEAKILDRKDAHYVQVKDRCSRPLQSPMPIAEGQTHPARSRWLEGLRSGRNRVWRCARAREVGEADLNDAVVGQRMDLFSSVANTSAGGELKNCEILLFGNSGMAGGDLRIGNAVHLAARMTKTGKVGGVQGLQGVPNITAQAGGFRICAEKAGAKVGIIYIKDMEDAAEAKEAASR